MEQEAWQILIVEDDQRLAELTREYLESNGLRVAIEGNGAVAAQRIGQGLARRGWLVGYLNEPKGIHLMLNMTHEAVVDQYLGDVAAVLEELSGAPLPTSGEGQALVAKY